MDKNLPVYKVTIDPKEAGEGEGRLGISKIAYTDNPAILRKGVYFNRATEVVKEMFADSLKLRVAAPALIPMQIYRLSDELGEYLVEFTAEEIEILVADFMQNRIQDVFNLDHDNSTKVPAYILQSWIIDNPETDPSFTQYKIQGLTKGTFFVISQFTDKEYFQKEIIEKGRTGYSIEGLLGLMLTQIQEKIKQMNVEPINQAEKLEEVPVAATEEINAAETPIETPVELADAPMAEAPAEEAPTEAPKEASIDEAAILKILEPKLQELYKEIADLKSQFENKASEKTEEPVQMQKVETTLSKSQIGMQELVKFMSTRKK